MQFFRHNDGAVTVGKNNKYWRKAHCKLFRFMLFIFAIFIFLNFQTFNFEDFQKFFNFPLFPFFGWMQIVQHMFGNPSWHICVVVFNEGPTGN